MKLHELPLAVQECLAGFAILTRAGWLPDLVRMGEGTTTEGTPCAVIGVVTPAGSRVAGCCPLTPKGRATWEADLEAGMEAWNAASEAERDEVVNASALRSQAVHLLTAMGPIPRPISTNTADA